MYRDGADRLSDSLSCIRYLEKETAGDKVVVWSFLNLKANYIYRGR